MQFGFNSVDGRSRQRHGLGQCETVRRWLLFHAIPTYKAEPLSRDISRVLSWERKLDTGLGATQKNPHTKIAFELNSKFDARSALFLLANDLSQLISTVT